MPESSKDCVILITTSFQALQRAKQNNAATFKSDCLTTLLFACLFIEANLNKIIDFTEKEEEVRRYLNKNKDYHLGLQNKLIWFYFKFNPDGIDHNKAKKSKSIKELSEKLKFVFEGYQELYNFRNDVAHGRVNVSNFNIDLIYKRRQDAKNIVDRLYIICESSGVTIPRKIKYSETYY